MNKTVWTLLVILLLAAFPGGAQAQDALGGYQDQAIENRAFEQTDWEALSETLDYSGKPPKPKKKTEEPTTEPEPRDPPDFDGFPDLSIVFKIILLVLVIGLLAWLVYTFVQRNELAFAPETEEEQGGGPDLDNIVRLEEELDRRNVDPYLLKAEEEGNYHLAVRLHFLALLKQLHEQQLIHWKKDRTNRVYLNQMRSQETYASFRQLTLIFERVWYGEYHPPRAEYSSIKEEFTAYRERLQNILTP